MKQLTQEQRVIRLWAASGQIQAYRKSIDWGMVNLIACISGVAALVGFVLAMVLLATINGG